MRLPVQRGLRCGIYWQCSDQCEIGGMLAGLRGFARQTPFVQEAIEGVASLSTAGFPLVGAALDPIANPQW